jgi:hypothetical protein
MATKVVKSWKFPEGYESMVVVKGARVRTLRPEHLVLQDQMGAHRSWMFMLRRCGLWSNGKSRCNGSYVEKGTKIFERWTPQHHGGFGNDAKADAFAEFWDYMRKRGSGMAIDRINPDGDYVPGNVRWITKAANEERAWAVNRFKVRPKRGNKTKLIG